MWHLLRLQYQFSAIAFSSISIALGLQALVTWWSDRQPNLLGLVSLALSIIGIIVVPLAAKLWRWLWKLLPALGRHLFPDCNGIWQGTLLSSWKDHQTGAVTPPIPATFRIRQGLFSTHISMRTGESTSSSTRCWLEATPDAGRYVIGYTYRNDPKVAVSTRSTQHDGVAWLEVDTIATPTRITGRYYTTRNTSGDLDMKRINEDPDSPDS
jgi:hypothetical protein